MIDGLVGLQTLDMADHFVDRPETEFGHDLAEVVGDESEIVHHGLGVTGELGAQLRVLGGDADRAGVEMALAHHDAPDRDQRAGGEAQLLGARAGWRWRRRVRS